MTDFQTKLPAEMRKMQILLCAMTEFSRSNYRATKVSDIAAEAGISEAMIYKLFPTKRALFLGTLDLLSDSVLDVMEEERNKEPNALEALRNMEYMHVDRMSDFPESITIQFQAISESADKEIKKKLKLYYEKIVEFYREIVVKGIKEGSIRPDLDIDAVTFMFFGGGLIRNVEKKITSEEEFDRDKAIKMVDCLVDFLRK